MSLRILVHDVGHGQSIHAFTPSGQSIVIDLGCSDNFSPLEWLKRSTSKIDMLVITHPHGDHIDEILRLSELSFTVGQMWRPPRLTATDIRSANQASYSQKVEYYLSLLQAYAAPIPEISRIENNPSGAGGVSVKIFVSPDCGTSNINNHSLVVLIEYLGVKVVIPGDNEPPSWNSLLEQTDFKLSVTGTHVFMASHHGRESGYSTELLQVMSPKLCIISDSRVQDTDAVNRYCYHAAGWLVHSRNGQSQERFCVTTRSDGFVDINIGSTNQGNNYLSVTCN